MVEVANAPLKTTMKFEDIFVCDPSAKHMGFKSWDGEYSPPFITFPLALFACVRERAAWAKNLHKRALRTQRGRPEGGKK